MDLPSTPPFAIRARLLTPLEAGSTLHESDGLVAVDAAGRIEFAGAADHVDERLRAAAIDLRPWVLMPGMVDLHAHLPQLPNAGVGFAVDLLTWLDRLTFPTERSWSDATVAERLAPDIFEAFAAAGTTTVLAYGTVYAAAMEAAFQAAEAHGIRAILGKVMMDRGTYDPIIEPSTILERSLQESADLIARWHGAADGRLGYAVTPRFAVSCSTDMLRESADARPERPARGGRPTCPRIRSRSTRSAGCSRTPPTTWTSTTAPAGSARRPSWPMPSTSPSARRPASSRPARGSRTAPPPTCSSGRASCRLAHRLEAGLTVGLGSDVSGGPDASIFSVMRAGAYAQMARRSLAGDEADALGPLAWLRLGTLDGARALGLDADIGSLEAGKEADLIAVDPAFVAPLPGVEDIDPVGLMSRLIFRAHPDMVRAAWVRGRRLDGPGRRG